VKGGINGNGVLMVKRGKKEVMMLCPFREHTACANFCPHLDDSDKNVIRLTCGGTDVAIEEIKPGIGMDLARQEAGQK
jgi:hypothetical protein